MTRRQTKNITGIVRLPGIPYHDAWVCFICINCREVNTLKIGDKLLSPTNAYQNAKWECLHCGFVHSRNSDLPFTSLPPDKTLSGTVTAQRFWQAFFSVSTEHAESYWKQCNVCGRILPFSSFSKHSNWGPLQRQMECRACKAAINSILNPKRTNQQLFESSINRRLGDMLLSGDNEYISIDELFVIFNNKCFKCKKPLDKRKRNTLAIDHILPSKYLYPLTYPNAALLCKQCNDNKRDRWPSDFYTNNELIDLARLTGANLHLLSSHKPIINTSIDVDACITRVLSVRERSNLRKHLTELKRMIVQYGLATKISDKNRKILGIK